MTFYAKLQFGFKYVRYWLKASNGKGHGIHSPFVFNFIKNVLNDKKQYPAYLKVEKLRTSLLNNHKIVVDTNIIFQIKISKNTYVKTYKNIIHTSKIYKSGQ